MGYCIQSSPGPPWHVPVASTNTSDSIQPDRFIPSLCQASKCLRLWKSRMLNVEVLLHMEIIHNPITMMAPPIPSLNMFTTHS